MAIMKNIFLGACALLSVAQAAPLVLTVTDIVTQTHWEIINCTTTVWRPINESPAPSTVSATFTVSTSTTIPVVVSSSATTSVTSTYVAPMQMTPSTALATIAATTTVVSSTPAQVIAAIASTVSTTSATTSAPPTSVARAGTFVEASVSADCEGEGDACVGDITHWDGGLGACGWSVDTENDMSIALPYAFMGTQSNGNPYCGRAVTLLDPSTGVTMQATVGDKCMGCVDRAIDTTNILFNAVTSGTGDGRVSGIQWWFT